MTPDYGSIGNRKGAAMYDKRATREEQIDAIHQELQNEMRKALTGEQSFVPSWHVSFTGQVSEKLQNVFDAIMEACEHNKTPEAVLALFTGHCDVETLRESIIKSYANLNAEQIWEARQ